MCWDDEEVFRSSRIMKIPLDVTLYKESCESMGNGINNGTGDKQLNPQGNATRC